MVEGAAHPPLRRNWRMTSCHCTTTCVGEVGGMRHVVVAGGVSAEVPLFQQQRRRRRKKRRRTHLSLLLLQRVVSVVLQVMC